MYLLVKQLENNAKLNVIKRDYHKLEWNSLIIKYI